jgi:4-hydroxybenzoate polyprenyltransferase
MRKSNSFSMLIFVVILGIGVAVAYVMNGISNMFAGVWIIGIALVLAFIFSTRQKNSWVSSGSGSLPSE